MDISKRVCLQNSNDSWERGILCNGPIKLTNICNVLPRPADSNGPIGVKLNWNLKYRGYVYFEFFPPCTIYQAFNYLKSLNEFNEVICISTGHRSVY